MGIEYDLCFLLLLIRSQDSHGTSKYLCVLLSYKYGKKDWKSQRGNQNQ